MARTLSARVVMRPANVENFTLVRCVPRGTRRSWGEMGGARRIATALAAAAMLAAGGGCGGGDGPAGPAPRADGPPESVPALRPLDYDRVDRARREADEAAWRRDQLRRLEGHTSVPAALRRALLRGAIGKHRSRRVPRRLPGRAQGAAGARRARGAPSRRRSSASVETLAARGQLVAGRMPAVFLNLRRNTRTWTTAPFPRPGERRTFGDSPAVFQYVPGPRHAAAPARDVGRRQRAAAQLHPRAGALPAAQLARRLDALAALAAPRGGFIAWEYYYAYAQGSPPWISGMAQATAVQALSRGAKVLGKPRYRRTVRRALGAFTTAPPLGVAVPRRGRRRATSCTRSRRRCRSSTASSRPSTGCATPPSTAAARSPRGSSEPATRRRARRSAGSTRAPGRCTPPRARSRRSPTTSSPRASSSTSAGGPSTPRTATPRGASRATSTSRRGSGSSRSAGSGRGARRRCASRSPRAPPCRSGSTARAGSSWRATCSSRAARTTSPGRRRRAAASTCGCAPAGRRAASASRTGRSRSPTRSRSRKPKPAARKPAQAEAEPKPQGRVRGGERAGGVG